MSAANYPEAVTAKQRLARMVREPGFLVLTFGSAAFVAAAGYLIDMGGVAALVAGVVLLAHVPAAVVGIAVCVVRAVRKRRRSAATPPAGA